MGSVEQLDRLLRSIFSSIFGQILSTKQVAQHITKTALKANVSANALPALIEAVEMRIIGLPGLAPDVPASVFSKCVEAASSPWLLYAYGFRNTWLASIHFGVIAMLCAVAVRDPSKYFTNHVEIHLEKKLVELALNKPKELEVTSTTSK